MPCIDRCCQEAELQDYSRSYQLSGATHLTRPENVPTMRERERHYIFSSHLRADQMCRGSFLGTHQ